MGREIVERLDRTRDIAKPIEEHDELTDDALVACQCYGAPRALNRRGRCTRALPLLSQGPRGSTRPSPQSRARFVEPRFELWRPGEPEAWEQVPFVQRVGRGKVASIDVRLECRGVARESRFIDTDGVGSTRRDDDAAEDVPEVMYGLSSRLWSPPP